MRFFVLLFFLYPPSIEGDSIGAADLEACIAGAADSDLEGTADIEETLGGADIEEFLCIEEFLRIEEFLDIELLGAADTEFIEAFETEFPALSVVVSPIPSAPFTPFVIPLSQLLILS